MAGLRAMIYYLLGYSLHNHLLTSMVLISTIFYTLELLDETVCRAEVLAVRLRSQGHRRGSKATHSL